LVSLSKQIKILLQPDGRATLIESEEAKSIAAGLKTTPFRVSHIHERDGKYVPAFDTIDGPELSPHEVRAEAIAEEVKYINSHFAEVSEEVLKRHDAGIVSL